MGSKYKIFRAIHQLKTKYNISILYKIGKVSRSGYYKWLNSNINNDKEKRFRYSTHKTIDIDRVEPNLLNREFNCNAPNQNSYIFKLLENILVYNNKKRMH